MNLVLVLLLTTAIDISSNPINSHRSINNRTLNMVSKGKPPETKSGARYYVGSQIVSFLEAALGYVQSGLNFLIGRGDKEGSVGRSGKSRVKYKGYQVLRIDAQNQVFWKVVLGFLRIAREKFLKMCPSFFPGI